MLKIKSHSNTISYVVLGLTIFISMFLLIDIVILGTDAYNKVDTYNLPSAIESVIYIFINLCLYVLSIMVLFSAYYLFIPGFIIYSILVSALYIHIYRKYKESDTKKFIMISLVISVVNIVLAIILFYYVNESLFDIMLTR